MNVLVTGAAGFVGGHVVAALLSRGHQVTAVDRDEDRARGMRWFDQCRFVACDIHQLRERPGEVFGSADAVIHLAWPGLPNYKALFHHEVNLPADYRFLKSLICDGYSRVLVTGTCLEYGMRSGCLKEEMPAMPAISYALAKDTLRKFLVMLKGETPFTLQWARLFYMHGEGQNPNSLLAQLDRAIEQGEPAFNMSGGEQLRDYLPIDRVATSLTIISEKNDFDGIVNVCSGTPVSVRQLVESRIAEKQAHIRLNLGHYPYPDYEPMAFWGDVTRLHALMEQA
jgi:dTDP-6-deoxy-L-talose 4-dehydrogenase (NAD+)